MEGSGQMAPAEAGRGLHDAVMLVRGPRPDNPGQKPVPDMTGTAKGPLEVIPILEVTRL